jgi:hypothetical protein
LHVRSYARAVADADIDADSGSGEPQRRSEPAAGGEGLAGVTRAIGLLLAIGGVGLVVTGVPLIFVYRPDGVRWLHAAHNAMSMLFVGAAAGTVAVLSVAAVRRVGRVPPGWFVAFGALLVAIVGLMSGQLIAWDQLVMKSVTGSSAGRGVVDALSGDVRFVLVGDIEVSHGAYVAWAVVHVLAVPALALGLAWIVRHRGTSR